MDVSVFLRAHAKKWLAFLVAASVLLCGCGAPSVPTGSASAVGSGTTAPPPTVQQEEPCAVWVTYAELHALLGGSVDDAKAALDALFDRLCAVGVNTVFFHARAHSDAFYASACFATATWVQPLLDAGFDPLAYAVEAAHGRGMELHAWINPYRVGTDRTAAVCDDVFLHEGTYYYVPSSDTVQQKLLDGIRELLCRYDVDGIHFDDYFYPAGAVPTDGAAEFEADAFAAYTAAGGKTDIGHWRRLQVDRLVAATCRLAHAYGRVFGISPAARATHCREALYADVEKWMREPGYLDYICPQLYVGFQNSTLPFAKTLETWVGYARHASVKLYIGLPVYKAGLLHDTYAGSGQNEWAAGGAILARQVRLLQDTAAVDGIALYASSYLFEQTHTGLHGSPLYDTQTVKRELAALHEVLIG